MSRTQPIQTAFNGGELSGQMQGRTDLPQYRFGLGFCENWIPTPQGPLRRRAGTEHIADVESEAKLITLRGSELADDFCCLLMDGVAPSPGLVRIYDHNGNKIVVTSGEYYSTEGIPPWVVYGSWAYDYNSYLGKTCYHIYVYYDHPYNIPVWFYSRYTVALVNAGAHRWEVDLASKPYNRPMRLRVGTTPGGSDLADVTYTATSTWQTFGVDFTSPGAGDVYIEVAVQNSEVQPTSRVGHAGHSVRYTESSDDLDAPWTLEQAKEVQYDTELSANRAVLVHREVKPHLLQFTPPETWSLAPATFVNEPSSWDPAWPRTVEVGHQGRAYYGGVEGDAHRLWASKSGDILILTATPPGANEADPFDYVLSMKGTLLWLRGQKALLAGTEVSEHSVRAASGGVVAPGDLVVRDESYYGGASVQAVGIGDYVLFVTRDRKSIRAAAYSEERGGWSSRSVSFMAQHLTEAGVVELHFARTPFPQVFAVMQDATLRAAVYDQSEGVVAWYRIDVGGLVLSATVLDTASGSELWMIVQRGDAYTLERMPCHEVGVGFADSAVHTVVPADGIVTGLTHLEGETVNVVVDGALLPNAVVTSGEVDVGAENEGLPVIVGLPFTATARTLPLENQVPGGTTQGHHTHWADLTVRVNDSAAPLINGERAGDGRPFSTPTDSPEDLTTGDLSVASTEGNVGGIVTISQDLPLRTEVCALYGVAVTTKV